MIDLGSLTEREEPVKELGVVGKVSSEKKRELFSVLGLTLRWG